jgi:hypothetical protein
MLVIAVACFLTYSTFWIPQPLGLKLSVLVGSLFALFILWKWPKWQVESVSQCTPQERFQLENEARKTLAEVIGGLVLISGLFFTWRSLEATQENLNLSHASAESSLLISKQTLLSASEAQITERFTKAIEHLGSNNMNVRIGALYALERIANDSFRDYWPTMEILTAYVRQNSPSGKMVNGEFIFERNLPNVATDIQVVLTILGRRRYNYTNCEPARLNLVGTNLKGVSLEKDVHFEGASFRQANLEGAELWNAHLEDTLLHRANFRGANLYNAHLKGADLEYADLKGADLKEATGLTVRQLNSAYWDASTNIPLELEQPLKDALKQAQ